MIYLHYAQRLGDSLNLHIRNREMMQLFIVGRENRFCLKCSDNWSPTIYVCVLGGHTWITRIIAQFTALLCTCRHKSVQYLKYPVSSRMQPQHLWAHSVMEAVSRNPGPGPDSLFAVHFLVTEVREKFVLRVTYHVLWGGFMEAWEGWDFMLFITSL
jgi:hypothetical protein